MPPKSRSIASDHILLSDLNRQLELMSNEINKDRESLKSITTPIALMEVRAETAEAALAASDLALKALQLLQANSIEIIHSGEIVITSMKAIIKENDEDAAIKLHALADLSNRLLPKFAVHQIFLMDTS